MFEELVMFLLPFFMREGEREATLQLAFNGDKILMSKFKFAGASYEFVPHMITVLQTRGETKPGTQALWQFLLILRSQVGDDQKEKIDAFETWANSSHTESSSFPAKSAVIEQILNAIPRADKPSLDRLMLKQIEDVYQKTGAQSFLDRRTPLLNGISRRDMWKAGFQFYAKECQPELEAFLALCWYGSDGHSEYTVRAVKKWTQQRQNEDGYAVTWQYVPSLFLLYLVGIASVVNKKWTYLVDVLSAQTRPNQNEPLKNCFKLVSERVIEPYQLDQRPDNSTAGEPIGAPIQEALKPLFMMNFLSSEDEFNEAFDIFEFLLALYDTHLLLGRSPTRLYPRLGSLYEYSDRSEGAIASFLKKGRQAGDKWPVLLLFDNDFPMNRLIEVLTEYQRVIEEKRRFRSFPDSTPNYLDIYHPPATWTAFSI